jgi:hypothetical protein
LKRASGRRWKTVDVRVTAARWFPPPNVRQVGRYVCAAVDLADYYIDEIPDVTLEFTSKLVRDPVP